MAAAESAVMELMRAIAAGSAPTSAPGTIGAAQPLHYAADGIPGSDAWNPVAQAAVIAVLIDAGADPDAPTRVASRPCTGRCGIAVASAVLALLDGGADRMLTNGSGSGR